MMEVGGGGGGGGGAWEPNPHGPRSNLRAVMPPIPHR